jgi:hypothetical protein
MGEIRKVYRISVGKLLRNGRLEEGGGGWRVMLGFILQKLVMRVELDSWLRIISSGRL